MELTSGEMDELTEENGSMVIQILKFEFLQNGFEYFVCLLGKREGKGAQTWIDGSSYVGSWENDKPHGKEIITPEKFLSLNTQ